MADSSELLESRPLEALLSDIVALEALADNWGEPERNGAKARAEAVDALNAEAFRRLIRALREVPGISEALREAAADEVIYTVLRRHGILRPSLFERVEAALDSVRPMLAGHGGDAEIVSIEGSRVEIGFLGACDGCPASVLTFYAGVRRAIKEHVPEITEIVQASGFAGSSRTGHFVSPFAAYRDEGWSRVFSLAELPDGQTKIMEIAGRSVLLSRFGERVTCFDNACAHMGLAMDGGKIADGMIICPHHGFCYSLQSGECLTAPEVQLHPHGVRVSGDVIEVRLTQ